MLPCEGICMRRLFFLLFITFFLLHPIDSSASGDLTLWVHPYLPATELTARFTPLTTYLSEKLKRTVSIRVQKSYQAHLDFVGRDQADIAYLGPVSYIHMKDQYGPKPLLAKFEVNGNPFFYGMIIARKDSGINTLGDLVGKSFAFGDPNSTMSHIVPRGMLINAGIAIDTLQRYDFLNSHHNVALAVLGGYFDAGGVKEEVYYEFEEKGLFMVAKSPPIPEHLFVTRSNLPQELISQIRSHLVNVEKSPNKENILKSMKSSVTNLLPVVDQDYDQLRDIIKSLDK